jgi:hypothetical protein
MSFRLLLDRLAAAVPADEAADLSGLVNTLAQLAVVAGLAAYGTVYFALAARPGFAFAVVTAALAASGFAGAACPAGPLRAQRPGPARASGVNHTMIAGSFGCIHPKTARDHVTASEEAVRSRSGRRAWPRGPRARVALARGRPAGRWRPGR